MAQVTFRIHYATQWGEDLFLERRSDQRGAPARAPARPRPSRTRAATPNRQATSCGVDRVPMHYAGDGFWTATTEGFEIGQRVAYRYLFRGRAGEIRREPAWREVEVQGQALAVLDQWFEAASPDAAFLRQAFAGVIFRPDPSPAESQPPTSSGVLVLTLRMPRVSAGCRVCVSGDHPSFGDWDSAKALPLSGERYPLWEIRIARESLSRPIEFKFGLWSDAAQRVVKLEPGPPRVLRDLPTNADWVVLNCEHFRHDTLWKGAGVAIPVFSLRSETGYGVGEFTDLDRFSAWAAGCGLQLIQLLPVNDTSSDFTWKDSYPYKAISTAALHPIYLNVQRAFEDYDQPLPEDYVQKRDALNRLPQLDYEAVLKDKLAYLRQLFAAVGVRVLAGRAFEAFWREHQEWLQPYAAFCHLRDRHKTADFTRWDEYSTCAAKRIDKWFQPGAAEYGAVRFHCFVQFLLGRQLARALAAGHARGVAFKGDLPIGIDRSSVEAWTEPELFRMDRQTGAPPDSFSVLGQNWGFPTYKWSRMEADGYAWWRRRFQRMSSAFDALRIDHILGFFRIWEIPSAYREGIMGHYNPTLPLTRAEIAAAGFGHDPMAFEVGAAEASALPRFFGDQWRPVSETLLLKGTDGYFRLRARFARAAARQAWYASSGLADDADVIEQGLNRLGFEVLFLEDPDQPDRFHPRINLHETALFASFAPEERTALQRLHDDFFYRRHTAFWADEAMKKLPALMDASGMLICGEDLGMVPDCVPAVLERLGLLSLEVQRWPKRLGQRFGDPTAYPYMSVCTTSTHDMSTIRGWWEEEPATRQDFWRDAMRRTGDAPRECTADICRFVVEQNLAGASMWCVLPWQDWLGMDASLRHPVAAEERINVPANPRHYWRYRMHRTIEDLERADELNRAILERVTASGRRPEVLLVNSPDPVADRPAPVTG